MTELEKFFRLTVEVLCDRVPDQAMPTYIVGETADNEGSVFPVACGQVGNYPILIGGGDDSAGYPGGAVWAERVRDRYHIAPERIHLVPMAGPPNTLTEIQALVPYLVKQGWMEVVITAAPFHHVRAFLTLLGVLQKSFRTDIRVYNRVGLPLPWGEAALHSQGKLKAPRRELIGAEFERIQRYTAKGDLATVDQALEYLKRRDA